MIQTIITRLLPGANECWNVLVHMVESREELLLETEDVKTELNFKVIKTRQ